MNILSRFRPSQPQYRGAPVTAKEAQSLLAQTRNIHDLDGLVVQGHLKLANRSTLTELPANLCADSLDVSGCPALRALPPGLRARRINVSGCNPCHPG
jgi:hypothetical protein